MVELCPQKALLTKVDGAFCILYSQRNVSHTQTRIVTGASAVRSSTGYVSVFEPASKMEDRTRPHVLADQSGQQHGGSLHESVHQPGRCVLLVHRWQHCRAVQNVFRMIVFTRGNNPVLQHRVILSYWPGHEGLQDMDRWFQTDLESYDGVWSYSRLNRRFMNCPTVFAFDNQDVALLFKIRYSYEMADS